MKEFIKRFINERGETPVIFPILALVGVGLFGYIVYATSDIKPPVVPTAAAIESPMPSFAADVAEAEITPTPSPTATLVPIAVACDLDSNGIITADEAAVADLNNDGETDIYEQTACAALVATPTSTPTPGPSPTPTIEPLPNYDYWEVTIGNDVFQLRNYARFNWLQAGRHLAQTLGYPETVDGKPMIPELTIIPYFSDTTEYGFWFWMHEEKDGWFGSKVVFKLYFYDPGAMVWQDLWTTHSYTLSGSDDSKWVFPDSPNGMNELWWGKAYISVDEEPIVYADY